MDNSNDYKNQLKNHLGKHYVIGDLHGMYGTYMDAIGSINDEDTLYILGDVIDGGQHGIKILQDIMKRHNVELFLGDHEWKFMKCYEIMKKYDLCVEEFAIYTRMYDYIKRREMEVLSEESYTHGMIEIVKQIESKGLEKKKISKAELAQISKWIKDGGMTTLRSFVELSNEEQEQIIASLTNSIIIGFLNVDGKKECLVHATPYDQKFFLSLLSRVRHEELVRYGEIAGANPKVVSQFVTGCTERGQDQFKNKRANPFDEMYRLGYETLYGHTPQAGQVTKCKRDGSICLDISDNGAAMYCIENGLVRYIDREFDEPSGHISEPIAPKLIEDRLEEYIKENEIQENIIDSESISKNTSNPENPGAPEDPGNR